MNAHPYRHYWLGLALIFLLLPAAAPAASLGGQAGPLSWKTTPIAQRVTAAETATALKKATAYLGVPADTKPLAQAFVQVADTTPYGSVARTIFYAWRFEIPGVPVSNRQTGKKETVTMNILIDGENRGLVAAFTQKNTTDWTPRAPGMQARDPLQQMASDGWSVESPRTTAVRATVSQILSSLWAATGVNPQHAGQIFMRPRYVVLALPAKREGGRLTPLRRPGTYWVVRVTGTKTLTIAPPPVVPTPSPARQSAAPYMSGLIALFNDSGQSVRGIYLP
ncbi:MAG TPA: hypothetical protein DEP05_03315 [Betaproteobacteria bacterium]|nr:hypothetical protein [Betaproteobacteria bacterium]